MEKVLHAVVTDAELRDTQSVEQQLGTELSVGAFWFD
jgi:hypothetical protein